MSNVYIDKQKIDILANAIAAKSGESVTMTIDEMVSAVDGIQTGGGGTPTLETVTKTYTPSTSAVTDTITPSAGYDGIGEVDVTVSAMPIAQIMVATEKGFFTDGGQRKWRVRGRASIDEAETGFAYDGDYYGTYSSYNAISSGTSVTPTESAQTIGGAGTMMEGAVTVNAIPSNYVGSGIAQRDSSNLSASGATVTAPSGYYASAATKTISSGTATPAASISGTSATVSAGTNTLTLTKTVSNTPQVSAGYVSSGTAGNSNVSLTANVTTKAAATITPTTSNQTIASGTYLTGTQTISGDANLVAGNIKNGTTIFGVTGTYSGGGTLTVATKTATLSAVGQTLSFTGLSGTPKYWFVKTTSQISSSGSTTIYYITDGFWDGTSVKGNSFRIGSTRRIYSWTSGVSQSYSGGTLTITGGSGTGSSPGQFYGGNYELTYVY